MAIIQRFHEGGIFMYFILCFALFTFGFIFERAVFLYFRLKAAPHGFRKTVLDSIARGELKEAENYAITAGAGTAIGRIASLGCHLRANAGGGEELQARMDEKLSEEISQIDRRTSFLAMFGNVATLLGLLGTIVGMIHSFASVALANPMDRATLLSKGISEAMNCTAFGLLVAIPALIAYAIFQNKTDQVVTELTETTTQIYHDLLFLCEPDSGLELQSQDRASGQNRANRAPSPTLSV